MSVIYSIVLALGIARVLGGFADIARDWREVEAKWPFLGWLSLLLALHLGWWFGLWARFSAIDEVELSAFLTWFLVPASFYVASRLLVPEFPEGSPPNLEQRFSDVRVPFFACLVLSVAPVFPGLKATVGPPWLLAVFGALALTGVFVSGRRWNIALLCSMLASYSVFLALARSTLGG